MFFKNISDWSKKKLLAVTVFCYCLYFCIIVLAPAITVMVKYNVFQPTEGFRNITGLGIIVIVIVGIGSYVFVKKAIKKLPQDTREQQHLKFITDTIFDLFPIGICLYACFAVRDDIALAFSTLKICLILFIIGILFNGLCNKYLEAEWSLRAEASRNKEVQKRVKNGVV